MRKGKAKLVKFVGKLSQHVRPSRNFPLNNNPNAVISATRLKDHFTNVHCISSRNFSCEFCPKQFATLNQLKNHQTYHEEPKFECQMGCDKKFFKSVLRDGHHKTHLRQKDFVCPYENCDQKYFLKSHLSRHVKSVHEKVK